MKKVHNKGLFSTYFNLREETGGKIAKNNVTSRIKLQKKEGSREFGPFTVNKTSHPNLRLLIKAFENSDKVGVGYTTIEKNKGEVEPQLKKKVLYLVGGAVRDHLKGKTPRNYDLVTDATTSEIRMILGNDENDFTETKPRESGYASDVRYAKLPNPGTKNKVFYASRWDKQGKELEMTIEINGEKFELATMSKNAKSRRVMPEKGESASSVEEDADGRDFTINSLYIPLTTSDGDNNELIDPHGGAHHLKSGEVVPVGDKFDDRLSEDPSTALRYTKMVSKYGDPDKIPDKHKECIARHKDLLNVPPEHIHKEFLAGLENPDGDPRKYLKMFKNLGLLGKIYPGSDFDEEDMPEGLRGDRWMASAWVMKDRKADEIKKILIDNGWSKQEANDIAYLVQLYQWAQKNKFDPEMFYDIKKSPSGLTKSKIREFMQMAKAHGPEVDVYLNHEDSDITPYVSDSNGRKLNPEFFKILGRSPQGGEFEELKKFLSTKRFKDAINKLKRQ
jgi:tRNA nucleotidyltransferase/poly(A) polymerase